MPKGSFPAGMTPRIEQVEANAAAADLVLSDAEANELTMQARRFRPLGTLSAAGRLIGERLHR